MYITARGSLKIQDTKSPKIRHLGTIAQLCRAISSQVRHVSTIWENLFNSNITFTCSLNMVNFGPLTAEIVSLVWGTPANFNGFCVLVALLHGTLVVGVSQTAALNRGHHLYSAGRPSRCALAHILVITSTLRYIIQQQTVKADNKVIKDAWKVVISSGNWN